MMPWPLCGQASEGLAKDISPKVPEIACGLRTTWWVMESPTFVKCVGGER
jgi:hypothetical protein